MAVVAVRRPSITGIGERFRLRLASQPSIFGPGAGYKDDVSSFLDSFMEITHTQSNFRGIYLNHAHTYDSVKEQVVNGIRYINVGIVGSYRNPDPQALGGHAVAYVKINDQWYAGDDEKGFLLLRTRGPPLWETKYASGWNMQEMHYFYVSSLVPVIPEPNFNNYGFHGKISFKQYKTSCWGDSVQTILMNANGYREQFVHLYNLVKLEQPPIISSSFDKTHMNFNLAISRVLGIPEVLIHPLSPKYKCITLLSLSFIRMISWEPPYSIQGFVTHIEGAHGLHELLPEDTVGAYAPIVLGPIGAHVEGRHVDVYPDIVMNNVSGGSRKSRKFKRKFKRTLKRRARTYK